MKTWIKTSLAAALTASALFAGTAVADWDRGGPDGCPGGGLHGGAPGQIKERFAQHAEERLARLELALTLTSEQKPAWANFKKAAKVRAETVWKDLEALHKAGVPKTVLEKLQRAEDAGKQRARLLAETRKDVEAFYGKLSDAQKTVFDAEVDKLLSLWGAGGPHRGDGNRRGNEKGKRHGRG
ncbi:MAG: Spy/CpxP family protein refolding chaperone [Azoarcus sp.]|jgi:hypothetical protein|nr:Spy/CpxP family protein refolding chaperone [Azoarcus sp.]